jgi:polysaccharide deacetylase 2 family uncharacterized protein YibQ
MSASNDPNEPTSKGHIRGVSFVDNKTNGKTPKRGAEDADFVEEKAHGFLDDIARETWYELRIDNALGIARRAHNEATFGYAVALASLALNVVILAKHFYH